MRKKNRKKEPLWDQLSPKTASAWAVDHIRLNDFNIYGVH